MSAVKFAISIVFLVIIITGINIVIFFGENKPKAAPAQIVTECPPGLAEQAATKNAAHNESLAKSNAFMNGIK